MNKNSIFIGLGISGFFTLANATGVIAEKTPPSIVQCEKHAEQSEKAFRRALGYDLSDSQRMAYLRIGIDRRECINEAKEGPRLTIAGL